MDSDATTPKPSAEPATSPQIGVDEWVKRSDERAGGPGGLFGGATRIAGRTPPIVLLAGFIAFACVLPLVTSNSYVIGVDADTLLYVLLAIGLNVAVGWAGLLDLGYIAFYGFAAYAYAELSSGHYSLHWPTWQSVPVVIAGTVLLGFVLALPSRRLSGDYLAIVTLFFLQIFNNFTAQGQAWNWLGFGAPHDITGGPTGITNVDPFTVFGHKLTNAPTDYVWVAAAGITVIAVLFGFLNRSRTGRAWRALREDPLAAEAMGMPVKWLMLLAVAVGAGVAGFAGAVNGAYYQGVFPSTFTFPLLITVYAMVILGGAGSLGGVIFGAVVVNVLLEVLANAVPGAVDFLRRDPHRLAREAPTLARPRRRPRRPGRVRSRGARDRAVDIRPTRRRADFRRPDVVRARRLLRDAAPALDDPPGEHVHEWRLHRR